jgi:hypothetical protein
LAADCDPIQDNTGGHAPLVGYALGGFGIYGFNDYNGEKPVVDECNGHFGRTPDAGFTYHYHVQNVFNEGTTGPSEHPGLEPGNDFKASYYLGCYGPAKGKCDDIQGRDNYCNKEACGADLCVQPGSSKDEFDAYVQSFADPQWHEGLSVNDF